MSKLFKGVRGLTQAQYEELVSVGKITVAGEEILYDKDFIYFTPEDVTATVREHTTLIAQNTADIVTNKTNIETNAADIATLQNTTTNQASEITAIKNNISEIIVRDTNQDNRLTNIEENFATKEYVTANGGKIDYIAVNGVDQTITDKRVNITVPDVTKIETELATNVVTLDGTQTITGPKTFTEHIYLANSDGTVDRISHLNNNFIIHSGATNSAVLNIDEGLEKIYAFNNELAFKSDIAEAAGTTVYVNGAAVADLSFSADPQTQINLLATSIDDNKSDLSDAVDTKVSKAGDTMTGELVASSGVAFGNNKVRAENSGNTLEIVHIEDNVDKNVFNYTHGGIFTLNNSETPLTLQGLDDRPSYVSGAGVMSNLALESDVKTAIDGLGTVFDLKGTKDTLADLPSADNTIGDVWYVISEQVGYIWLNDGTEDRWERFGSPIDLSGYATSDALDAVSRRVTTNTNNIATKADISDIPTLLSELSDDTAHRLVSDDEKLIWNSKLDGYVETDPTVPDWAKASTKPEYDYSEILNTPESVVLYSETGQNTDGPMTQKATTDALDLKANIADINFDAINFAEEERKKSNDNLFDLFYNNDEASFQYTTQLSEHIKFKNYEDADLYTFSISSVQTTDGIVYTFDCSKHAGALITATLTSLKPNTTYRLNFTVDAFNGTSCTFMGSDDDITDPGNYSRVFMTDGNGEYVFDYGIWLTGKTAYTISHVQLVESAKYTEYQKYYGPIVHESSLINLYQLDYAQTINVIVTATSYTHTNTLTIPVWINFNCQILFGALMVYVNDVLVDICRHFASERWSANTSLILNPGETVKFEGQNFQDYTEANLFIIPFKEAL